MKCHRIFEYIDERQDSSVDWSGWRLMNMPTFDPGVGFTVGHDSLEHFKPNETGIENECQAFGAMYHIRVQGEYWCDYSNGYGGGSEAKILAQDMARFLHNEDWNIQEIKNPIHDSLHDFCVEMKRQIILFIKSEYNYDINERHDHTINNALKWLSKGYLRSLKRWKNHEPTSICNLFTSIANNVESLKNPSHGQILHIRFDTKTLEHRIDYSHTY